MKYGKKNLKKHKMLF